MEPVIYAGCTNNVQAQSTGRSGVQNCWRSCNAASSSEQMNKRLGVAQTPELLDDDALASPASLSPACSERSPHCLSREAQTPIVHQERKGAIPKSERLVICTQVSGIWWAWPASDRPSRCRAMNVATCCAHACLTVPGGKALGSRLQWCFLNTTSPVSTTSSFVELGNEIFFRKGVPVPPCPALPCIAHALLSLFVRARLTTPCLALCRSSFERFLHPQ